jgi:hypothetical protein
MVFSRKSSTPDVDANLPLDKLADELGILRKGTNDR